MYCTDEERTELEQAIAEAARATSEARRLIQVAKSKADQLARMETHNTLPLRPESRLADALLQVTEADDEMLELELDFPRAEEAERMLRAEVEGAW